jgi:Ribonuclease HI
MRTDTVIPRYSFAKKFTVIYPDRSEWKRRNIQSLSKGPVWYTDGSKTSSGTGGCVFGGKTELVFSLGTFATVFQAEVFAIMASIHESIMRGYNGRKIMIFTDSQADLKALESVTVRSKLVLEHLGCLDKLATHNSVQLVWVPGHEGILGNEKADELGKKGADSPFTGPEPVLGLPYSMVK